MWCYSSSPSPKCTEINPPECTAQTPLLQGLQGVWPQKHGQPAKTPMCQRELSPALHHTLSSFKASLTMGKVSHYEALPQLITPFSRNHSGVAGWVTILLTSHFCASTWTGPWDGAGAQRTQLRACWSLDGSCFSLLEVYLDTHTCSLLDTCWFFCPDKEQSPCLLNPLLLLSFSWSKPCSCDTDHHC